MTTEELCDQEAFLASVLEAAPDNSVDGDDLIKILDFHTQIRAGVGAIENVMRGTMRIMVRDGEIAFEITESGIRRVEEMGIKI